MANMKATMNAVWAKMKKRPDPLTSVALTIPVFLIYHLCIVQVSTRSRVDLISDQLLTWLQANHAVYVVAALTLALGLAIVTWVEERRGALSPVPLRKVVLEGLVLSAAVLAVLAAAPRHYMRTTEPATTEVPGVLEAVVVAAGTGLHQEVVFRAVLVTLLGGLLAMVFRVSKKVALGVAVTLSSITFALTHNYGAHGEPFVPVLAAYQMLLGGLFAGVYLLRGFAVAVYAHFFFEIGVRFFRA
jgi:Type II CAAX prenyl endopeptidase Rce1-like